MASQDILLEARGDASNLESEFEGAQVVVERAMDGAQRAIESVDPSALEDAGANLGDALAEGAERAGDALQELASDLDSAATSARLLRFSRGSFQSTHNGSPNTGLSQSYWPERTILVI